MRRLVLGIVLAAALGAVLAGSARAYHPPVTCGDTISSPGTYNVEHSCSGPGITITSSDVVLRLNGHTLNDPPGGDGIDVETVSDVRIEGPGKLTGYSVGINFSHVSGSVIEQVKVLGSTGHGISFSDSDDNVLKYDHVTGSGGHGLALVESNGNVLEDDVSTGNALNGIDVEDSSGNRVAYDTSNGNGEIGVSVGTSGDPTVENRIEHVTANDNGWWGIALFIGTTGNAVTYSNAHGNTIQDALDEICSNRWSHDKFGSFVGCS